MNIKGWEFDAEQADSENFTTNDKIKFIFLTLGAL